MGEKYTLKQILFALRKEYLEHFRSHFKSRLENIKVVSPEEYEQEMKNKNN